MSSAKKPQSTTNTISTSTLITVKDKPVWPKVLGIIGIVLLVVCAAVIPAVVLTTMASGSRSNSDGSAGSVTNSATSITTTSATLKWNSTGVTVAGVVGSTGLAAHLLNYPYAVYVDSSNSFYIADRSNNRVQKWLSGASNGTTVAGQANGGTGSGTNLLSLPTDVVADSSGNVYVADKGNNRVQLWLSGGSVGTTVAGTTGSMGAGNSQLNGPYSFAYDSSSGTLYVSDFSNHRVMRYLSGASSGTLVAGGNGLGTSNTQLNGPVGIHFDSSTNSLLIANSWSNNIVRWVIGASNWTLVAGSSNGGFGTGSTLLDTPSDVTLDSSGNMYVADTGNCRVQLFLAGQSNATTVAGATANCGSAANLLNTPYGLALDSQLNLYVADTYNHRIQKFSRA